MLVLTHLAGGAAAQPAPPPKPVATLQAPAPISGHSLDALTPADLMARVTMLHDVLTQLRVYMGKPAPPPPLFRGVDASIEDVFFVALNLKRRSLRLGFEQLRVEQRWDDVRQMAYTARGAFRIFDEMLVDALRVKASFGIEAPVVERPAPPTTTDTAVFNQLVATGALLNALLDKRTDATDLFSFTTYALHSIMPLHGAFTDALMPNDPEFVPNVTPAEVYAEVEKVFEDLRPLAKRVGVGMMRLERTGMTRAITSDDVGELIVLTIGQITRFQRAAKLPSPRNAGGIFGRRFPSHALQRVRLLRTVVGQIVAGSGPAAKPAPTE